jgi:hypothetical protein
VATIKAEIERLEKALECTGTDLTPCCCGGRVPHTLQRTRRTKFLRCQDGCTELRAYASRSVLIGENSCLAFKT